MQCQATVPEQRFAVGSHFVDDPAHPGQPEQVLDYRTEPEHPCEEEALVLARSMKEVAVEGGAEGETDWQTVKDEVYCLMHFVPGLMTHLDGTLTFHAPMSVESLATATRR
jgi:hypothetical protein